MEPLNNTFNFRVIVKGDNLPYSREYRVLAIRTAAMAQTIAKEKARRDGVINPYTLATHRYGVMS